MTINLQAKKVDFIYALANLIVSLNSNTMEQIDGILTQWNAMSYASGSNAITDGDAAAANPAYSASIINNAIGALTAIQTTYQAQDGYLEPMRP